MAKKNKNKGQLKEAVFYENGKTGGANFRQYQSFLGTLNNANKMSEEELNNLYIGHLIKEDNISKRGAERIMNMINKRASKQKGPETEAQKITRKLEEGKDNVRVGKPLPVKYKKKLDAEFNKWLGRKGIESRDRDDIYILLEKYIEEKGLTENTNNNIRTAVSFFQDEKYQKRYKNSEVKAALQDASRKKNNTKNDIIIPGNLLKPFTNNINTIDKIFRKLYSPKAPNPSLFKYKTNTINFARWYTFVTNGGAIEDAEKQHYIDYAKYMQDQGYAPNSQHYAFKGIKKFSREGKWKFKMPKNNDYLNLDMRVTGKVHRAWSGDEFMKAFELAANGTGKAGGCKRPDVALYMLTIRVFGERADECLNMTLDQFKTAIGEQYLKLTKTKNNRPREIPSDVINLFNNTFHLFEQFIEICDKTGIEQPFKELFERHGDKKSHNIKQSFQQWVNHHRKKFEDKDRIKNSIINESMRGKKRGQIDVQKAELTLHGLRHSLAQEAFHYYYESKLEKAKNDIEYRDYLINKHREESIKNAIKRKWNHTKDYSDSKVREQALYARIAIDARKEASEVLGHSRADILNTYLTSKINNTTSIKINMKTLQTYMLVQKEEGDLELTRIDDFYDDILQESLKNIDSII